MKIKQTVGIIATAMMLSLVAVVALSPVSSAADRCGGVDTAIIHCDQDGTGNSIENSGVWGILLVAINILTAGVGVVALGGIVYAAILYTSAGGSQEQIKKAMTIITNIVIGVLAFALMYAVLNFLIPGGLFA